MISRKDGLRRRAALWLIAHVASTEDGFMHLSTIDEGWLESLLAMVQNDPSYSFRGTLLCALGLIAKSPVGSMALLEMQDGASMIKHGSAFTVLWKIIFCSTSNDQSVPMSALGMRAAQSVGGDDDAALVCSLISSLGNPVSQKRLMQTYGQYESRLELFESLSVLVHVSAFLAKFRFKLPIRRYVNNLFDSVVLRRFDETEAEPFWIARIQNIGGGQQR